MSLLGVYDLPETFDGALTEMEERAKLERAGQAGAAVEIDAMDRGPLYQYALARREDAIAALVRLVEADPRDAAAIGAAQAEVRDYLRVARWARGTMQTAVQAEQDIKERYSDDSHADY